MSALIEVVALGDAVRPTRPRVKPADFSDLPFIGMEHIEAHSMKLLGTVPAKTMKSSAVHFKPGDVLYGRLRPYLNKVYRPSFEGLCSAEFIVLPENDRVDGAYLQYFLNSDAFVRYATHLNTGDRPRVDFDQLAAYKIPLPGIDDQRCVVAEIEKQFSRLDEIVASLSKIKAGLKRYKAAVLTAAKNGKLAEFNAKSVPFGDLVLNFDGKRIPLKRADRDKRAGPYPYYGASGVIDDIDDYIFDGDFLLIGEDGANLLARSTPIAFRASGRFWVNNHAHVVQARPGVSLRFLEIILNGTELKFFVTGSAQPKLTQANLKKIPVPLPAEKIQAAIVAEVDRRFSIVDETEAQLNAQFSRELRLRQITLSKAFGVN